MLKIGIGILIVTLSLVVPISFAAAGPKKGGSALKDTRPGANHDMAPRQSVAGFTYSIKDFIRTKSSRTKSSELCSSYGSDADCVEAVEICLTMKDRDEDVVRVCINTAPEEGRPVGLARARGR
jgi:hypothetical protein